MKILALVLSIFLVGCQTSNMEYYQAVIEQSKNQSAAIQAKSSALASLAKSDSGAGSSAVLALALMDTNVSQNIIPQKSAVLEWSTIVAPLVASLGTSYFANDTQKSMSRHNYLTNVERIKSESSKTAAMFGHLGTQSDNMTTISMGGFDAVNKAGAQSVELGLGLGLASINSSGGSGGDNSAILDALGNLNWPDYSTNFKEIMDALGGITIPDYSTELDDILSRLTAGVTTWTPGVNCVSNGNGVIGVGSSTSALPVCPN
tara:strand:+ start:1990 stop:2772 length:783 start_codon:yes stop_codon:yes gene_type:complete